jgi:hypothetical protein
LTEVEAVAAVLSLRAGYSVDLFGGTLYARSLEDGTFAVGSETETEGWEEVVPSARSAAERLVAYRTLRGVGADVEADAYRVLRGVGTAEGDTGTAVDPAESTCDHDYTDAGIRFWHPDGRPSPSKRTSPPRTFRRAYVRVFRCRRCLDVVVEPVEHVSDVAEGVHFGATPLTERELAAAKAART